MTITTVWQLIQDSKVLSKTFKSIFEKQPDVLWNRENYSFNTTKISHHFGYENISQKNRVTKHWMKQLVVLVNKYNLSDISEFC